jgi:hypothetical protein
MPKTKGMKPFIQSVREHADRLSTELKTHVTWTYKTTTNTYRFYKNETELIEERTEREIAALDEDGYDFGFNDAEPTETAGTSC